MPCRHHMVVNDAYKRTTPPSQNRRDDAPLRDRSCGCGGLSRRSCSSARSPWGGARQALDELLDGEGVVTRPEDERVGWVDAQLRLQTGEVPSATEDVELGALGRQHGEEQLCVIAGFEVLLVVHEDEHLGRERGLQRAEVVADAFAIGGRGIVPAARAQMTL